MSDNAQQIENFREFAKGRLQNHTNELSTRYQNRDPVSNDLRQEAYKEHQKIFEKEMEHKIEELLAEDNQYLRPALNDMKKRFVEKLRLNFHN